jgi:hypothetical protein
MIKIKELSICCNSDVRSNGYVNGTDYGWTCNNCERKCEVKIIEIRK